MARGIEDEFGHVQQLILIGKERGYLLYDEINDSLPADVHSSQEIDYLLSALERQGIEIYEDIATANATRRCKCRGASRTRPERGTSYRW